MSRGQLVPDDTIVRVFLDRLARRRRRRAARSSTASRGPQVQAEALDDALRPSRPPRRPRAATSTSRSRTSSSAWRTGASARPTATSTTSSRTRRRSRASATSTAPTLVQRADDARGDRPGPDGPAGPAAPRRRRALPPPRRPRDGRRHGRPIAGVDRRASLAALDEPAEGGLTVVTRKSRPEIERMRRAGRVVAEVLDLIEAELRPGVSTAHLDAHRRGAHPRAPAAIPSFKGYPGINPRRPFPASVCISIDDEIVHGIPGDADHPRRPDRLGRRRRHRRRLARRRRPDLLRRRAAAGGAPS